MVTAPEDRDQETTYERANISSVGILPCRFSSARGECVGGSLALVTHRTPHAS